MFWKMPLSFNIFLYYLYNVNVHRNFKNVLYLYFSLLRLKANIVYLKMSLVNVV